MKICLCIKMRYKCDKIEENLHDELYTFREQRPLSPLYGKAMPPCMGAMPPLPLVWESSPGWTQLPTIDPFQLNTLCTSINSCRGMQPLVQQYIHLKEGQGCQGSIKGCHVFQWNQGCRSVRGIRGTSFYQPSTAVVAGDVTIHLKDVLVIITLEGNTPIHSIHSIHLEDGQSCFITVSFIKPHVIIVGVFYSLK